MELLLTEPPDDLDEELLAAGARKLRKHRLAGGLVEEYEVQAADEDRDLGEERVENFRKLQERVAQLAENGQLTHDHPDYQKYIRLVTRFQGKGQFEFVEHPSVIGAGTERYWTRILTSPVT